VSNQTQNISTQTESPSGEPQIQFDLQQVLDTKRKLEEHIDAEFQKVQQSLDELQKLIANPTKKVKKQLNGGRRVQFNVGGKLFSTSFAAVMSEPNILKMICELEPDQPIFIDRDHEEFDSILEYFRTKNVASEILENPLRKKILLEEASFYEIDGLIQKINSTSSVSQKVSRTTKRKEKRQLSEQKSLSDGAKLMDNYENELETTRDLVTKQLCLLSSQTEDQTSKIKRFFGWTPTKLDVGGVFFDVGPHTFNKFKNANELFATEDDGSLFIDRSPDTFNLLLRHVRDQSVALLGLKKSLREKFASDLEFYGIQTNLFLLAKSIRMTHFCNMTYDETTDKLVSSGSKVGFDKVSKSDEILSGIHQMSVKIDELKQANNIMLGYGPEKDIMSSNVSSNLYNTDGVFVYLAGNSLQGNATYWPRPAAGTSAAVSLANWPTVRKGDTVTLELDLQSKQVSGWVNGDIKTRAILCPKVPTLPRYHFYILGYEPGECVSVEHFKL